MSRVKYFAKFEFWAFFKIYYFDFVLFRLGIWIISMGNHGAAGVSQNAGVLVVLVICKVQPDSRGNGVENAHTRFIFLVHEKRKRLGGINRYHNICNTHKCHILISTDMSFLINYSVNMCNYHKRSGMGLMLDSHRLWNIMTCLLYILLS